VRALGRPASWLTLPGMEWRLEWRSPGLWAGLALATVYAAGGALRESTYLGLTLQAGAWLSSLLPLAMSLVWIGAHNRPANCKTAEMVEASSMPRATRLAAEMAGGASVAFAVAAIAASLAVLSLFLSPLTDHAGRPGLAGDLWLAPLTVAPVIVFWLGASRLLARLLPARIAYVSALVLWAVGLWLRPPASYFAPIYAPSRGSELTLLGPEGARLLITHRLVLLGLGLLLGLAACVWGSKRRAARQAAGVLAGLVVFAGLLSAPGVIHLAAGPEVPQEAVGWLAEAETSRRWVEILAPAGGQETEPAGTAFLAVAHARWGDEVLKTLAKLVEEAGERGTLSVVEAPVDALAVETTGERLLVLAPEAVFRIDGRSMPGMISRRLITQWVAWITGSAAEAGRTGALSARAGQSDADGVRRYLEWVLGYRCLDAAVIDDEVEAWRDVLRSFRAGQSGAVPGGDGRQGGSGDQTTFPKEGDLLRTWRGGSGAVSGTSLSLGLALWDRLGPGPETADLVAAYLLWAPSVTTLTTIDPAASAEEFIEIYGQQLGGKP